MEVCYYPDADALWVRFGDGPELYGELVGDNRVMHYGRDGELFASTLLYASEGLELDLLPERVQAAVRDYLKGVALTPTLFTAPGPGPAAIRCGSS